MKLINDDCINVMQDYTDNYFDLAIVDPPYGKKPHREGTYGSKCQYNKNKKSNFILENIQWDIKPNKNYFHELFRISKHQIIWGMNYFIDCLTPTNSIIVWDKKTGNNVFADCEIAWSNHKSKLKKFDYLWLGSHAHRHDKLIHPTQKPVALYRWLLENYAKSTDKIIDTHLGSGSSAIASHYFEIKEFVGIEIDKEYYNNAVNRIKKETMQLKLI